MESIAKDPLVDAIWLTLLLLLGAFVFTFGFIRRVNEFYHVTIKLGKKRDSIPPGDLGWPFLGNLGSFLKAFKSNDPNSFLHDLAAKHGRRGIYRSYLFGSPAIIISVPQACKMVLADDNNFELGYPASTKALSGRKSFHSISREEHKRLRRLTTAPISGHEALSLYIGLIEDIVVKSLKEWSTMEHVEFLTEMKKIAFKVITHIFMGSKSDSVIGNLENLYTDFNLGIKSTAINLPGFAFHKALKARKKLVKILQGVLDERKTAEYRALGRQDMVDMMMGIEDEDEDGGRLEDEDIIDILVMYLLAGHESSAHSIMWVCLLLQENPEFLHKAKVEQLHIVKRRPLGQKGLSLKEIREMSFANKAIDEMLRKVSLSFATFRQAKQDVMVAGYLIPKGWKVLVWAKGVHMDPQVYTNPNKYDPARWENFKAKAGSFIPFGLGSRMCPGADLAKLEITIFLHYFLLNYSIERVNPDCPVINLPIPRPEDNCLAKIKKLN